MTNEERKAINNIKAFIRSIRSDLVEESEDNQELANDLDTARLLIQEQQERINYLENNRKQVKEQLEAAQTELSFAVDMLTDV